MVNIKVKKMNSFTKHNSPDRSYSEVSVGCWNMRSLVESEGPKETSVSRPGGRGVAVERKASFMVREMRRFGVNIMGISETKWFGAAVYDVDGFTLLHSGRPLPEDSPMERNEGVGIVLDPTLSAAWRAGGEIWKAVSSRIILAKFKLQVPTTRSCVQVSVVSVYAPTYRASNEIKEEFFSDLQNTLNNIDQEDFLILVGDFNARVGSSDRESSEMASTWEGVRGYHGVGRENDAGKELLSFCALNELTLMNTFFEKHTTYKYTWQHPGSKKWHCIDYIILRQKQRRFCTDVSVLRHAECWTDHKLLRAKIRLSISPKLRRGEVRKKFAVSRLKDKDVRERYSKAVLDGVSAVWCSEDGGEGKWQKMRKSLTSAAENVLGWEKHHHPNWFRDSITVLEPMIQKRNMLFAKWLSSHSSKDRQRYVTQRRMVAKEVKRAKNAWFQRKADEIERSMKGGVGTWKGLRDIQRS